MMTTIEQFEEFAQSRLNNHMLELNTVYTQDRPSAEVLADVCQAHHLHLQQELDDKIDALTTGENDWVAKVLEIRKRKFEQQLESNTSVFAQAS